MTPRHGLVIHGGAGTILRSNLAPELESQHTAALTAALDAGYAVLESGGTSLDAVVAATRILEDSPHFNAGDSAQGPEPVEGRRGSTFLRPGSEFRL